MLNTELKSLGVSPAPAWAIENPYETNENPGEDFINGGVCALLSDSQVDLTGDTPAWYTRIVYRILTTGGAERSAQFAVSFDPSYQRLEVHGIKAIRGDRIVDHARLDSLDLIRRETDLERRVLNGRLTATLIIHDRGKRRNRRPPLERETRVASEIRTAHAALARAGAKHPVQRSAKLAAGFGIVSKRL